MTTEAGQAQKVEAGDDFLGEALRADITAFSGRVPRRHGDPRPSPT